MRELIAVGGAAEEARSEADGRWWGIWSDFCFRRGYADLPVDLSVLRRWVESEGPGCWSPATVDRVVVAVLDRHQSAGYQMVEGFGS